MTPTRYSNFALYIICILVFWAPVARGSVHPWATTVIQLGVLLAGFAVVLESVCYNTSLVSKALLSWPIICILFLCFISTMVSGYFPWDGFFLLLTYALVYFILQIVVRTKQHRDHVIYTIVGTALFLAILGLLKRFEMVHFWEYPELKYSKTWLASSFGNHNHMAGFLEMALPFAVILFFLKENIPRYLLWNIFFVLLITQVLTLSRGGWISSVLSFFFMGFFLLKGSAFKRLRSFWVIGAIALIGVGFILISSPIIKRGLSISQKMEEASFSSRILAWKGTLNLIQEVPFFGTGPGTYSEAFSFHQPPGLSAVFLNAHNDYLQFASDVGLFLWPFFLWFLYRLLNAGISSYPKLAVLTCVFALLVHSTVDFNFHIPSNALLASLICSFPFIEVAE